MKTPHSTRKADAKKNAIKDSKRIEKVVGNVTILASQVLWGDNSITRTINVYHTGAIRTPWDDGYEQDIESYEFRSANDANRKFLELVKRYSE